MNLLKVTLFCLLLLSFFSCSKIQKWREGAAEETSESGVMGDFEEDEFSEEVDAEEEFAEEGGEEEEATEIVEDETVDEAVNSAEIAAEEHNGMQDVSPQEGGQEGGMREYVIEQNDTLMWIAFKLYGDYSRWRELINNNPGLEDGKLEMGSNIQYHMSPGEEFEWNPGGHPYLIVGGDTLGVISNKVYGTQGNWKSIWHHNRVMIKDPNLIFAGFTLYYLEADKIALSEQGN